MPITRTVALLIMVFLTTLLLVRGTSFSEDCYGGSGENGTYTVSDYNNWLAIHYHQEGIRPWLDCCCFFNTPSAWINGDPDGPSAGCHCSEGQGSCTEVHHHDRRIFTHESHSDKVFHIDEERGVHCTLEAKDRDVYDCSCIVAPPPISPFTYHCEWEYNNVPVLDTGCDDCTE